MARIYNPNPNQSSYQGSAQGGQFFAERAVDTSKQEIEKMNRDLRDINTLAKSDERRAVVENSFRQAQNVAKSNSIKMLSQLGQLSVGAMKVAQGMQQAKEEQTNYNNQVDATFNSPLDGYSMGEISPKAESTAVSAQEFNERQIAVGQASIDVAEGDTKLQSEIHRSAVVEGNKLNIGRQNAYQASKSIGVFMNDFMDSNITITRPDGSTFTPATAESDDDLRAALSLAAKHFGAQAGLEDMNQAAVQRNLIPATDTAMKVILGQRGDSLRTARHQAAYDSVMGTALDGVTAGEDPRTLFDEAFAGLVGLDGRTKGQASKDALNVVLSAIEDQGSLQDYEALEKYTLSTGHTLGKGVTGKAIRDSKDRLLDRVHNDNVRLDRVKKETLEGYKESRYRELIEAGADPEKIRAVEEKYIGLARELGGTEALSFEKTIVAGGISDSTVAFDLLMDQAQQGQLDETDVRDAFDAGILNTTQLSKLSALVGNEAAELKAAVQPYESEIKRLAKGVTEKSFGSSNSLMGGSKDENASIEADINRTITNRVSEFIRLNPGIEPGRISDYAEKVRDGLLKDIQDDKAAASEAGIPYKYQYSGTPALNKAQQTRYKDLNTGREVRDLTSFSTYDLQQAGFNNADNRRDNDINPSSDRILGKKELQQYVELYRTGGEAALPDRVKVVAGAVGDMSPRVLLEQQGQAYGINVDLRDHIRAEQARGLDPANLPQPESLEQRALDVIGTYESDGAGGYDAVNQYGADGGHSTGANLGMYSGRFSQMRQHGGRQLTSMTLQEIMDLQSDDGTLTNAQWRDAGRLHAVGRYQFIGSTLANIVQQSGIDPNTRFTPEVQDAMALYLLRTARSGIGQWVGPATHATMDEKEIVRSARLLESGETTRAQLVRIARMFS